MLLSTRPSLAPAAPNVISLADHPLTLARREADSAQQKGCAPATNVDSPLSSGQRISQNDVGKLTPPVTVPEFKLIQFLDQMTFQASIEIDDLLWIRGHFTVRVRHQIMSSVRKLLCEEFGRRLVERNQLLFTVQHRDVNALIAGLLRVQFYANQILLPEYNVFGDRVEQNGVTVTWGVGRSIEEAQHERIKKRKRRNLRRR